MRGTPGLAVAFAAAALACVAAPAAAATCPNATTTTVATDPSYTYVRGCIVSFDGTPIVYNLFEPLHPAPRSVYAVLNGPGWPGPGATTADSSLIRAGFAQLTWDPRGFGQSGGLVESNSPLYEGRDAKALIDQVLVGRTEIAVDECRSPGSTSQPHYVDDIPGASTCGQPVVGMTGGSYGGSIQLALASIDRRVKAIVPADTWNDLRYALYPNGVNKQTAGLLLYGLGIEGYTTGHATLTGTAGIQTGGYDPMLHYMLVDSAANGHPDDKTLAWLGARSMAVYGRGLEGQMPFVPTLLSQGINDALFNINDLWANATELQAARPRVPVKVMLLCQGHLGCAYSATATRSSPLWPGKTAGQVSGAQAMAWLRHYLRGEGTDDGMPAEVAYQSQDGDFHPLPTVPTAATPGPAQLVEAKFAGTLVGHGVPTAVGPTTGTAVATDGPTSTADPGQLTVPVLKAPAGAPARLVGIGHIDFTATIQGPSAELFFRLIDRATGEVVDLMTQPVRIDNPAGGTHHVSVDLAGVAYHLAPGDSLDLQVSTSSSWFTMNRTPAIVSLSGVAQVPVLSGSTR